MEDDRTPVLTKIIATLGPSSNDVETVGKLIRDGARVFRINFSHGSRESHAEALRVVRAAEAEAGIPIGVLGDLSGPKIRLGQVVDGGVSLAPGDAIVLQKQVTTAGAKPTNADEPTRFSVTMPQIIDDIEPGQRVLFDDGNVRGLAFDAIGEGADREIHVRITAGHKLSTAKGVNLPDTKLHVPSITDYDLDCARWAVDQQIDYIALSFVRHAQDLVDLRQHVRDRMKATGRASDIPPALLSKIEKPEALDELEAIIQASDAVMVARGDLGVEMDLAKVPIMQKRIIRESHRYGKPVAVATQMLQSMIDSPTPTRAEASDVASAIFDGADAVMLSGETAVGSFPTAAVHTMARIARAIQADARTGEVDRVQPVKAIRDSKYRTAALAHGVNVIVSDLDAAMIVIWSERGGGARYLSQNRPNIPILAFSSNQSALRRMAAMFGVMPRFMDRPTSVQAFVDQVDDLMQQESFASLGDPVVFVVGEPIGTAGVTNELRIHYVGDACRMDKRS